MAAQAHKVEINVEQGFSHTMDASPLVVLLRSLYLRSIRNSQWSIYTEWCLGVGWNLNETYVISVVFHWGPFLGRRRLGWAGHGYRRVGSSLPREENFSGFVVLHTWSSRYYRCRATGADIPAFQPSVNQQRSLRGNPVRFINTEENYHR
jgi:hypothetical protein